MPKNNTVPVGQGINYQSACLKYRSELNRLWQCVWNKSNKNGTGYLCHCGLHINGHWGPASSHWSCTVLHHQSKYGNFFLAAMQSAKMIGFGNTLLPATLFQTELLQNHLAVAKMKGFCKTTLCSTVANALSFLFALKNFLLTSRKKQVRKIRISKEVWEKLSRIIEKLRRTN